MVMAPAGAPSAADDSADSPSARVADDPVDGPAAPDTVLASASRPGRNATRTGAAAPSAEAQALVEAHNRLRARHCARPLAWSTKLAQVAQQWANTLRDKGCMFGHSDGSYGENLAAGTSGTLDPGAVVGMWYDEVAQYRFPNGGFSMKTGHFTQLVWRATTHVGCGRSQCKGMDLWVCEYDPAGNWEGQYRDNVLPVGCRRD
jgi:uncharacterized protein YkwD